MKPPRHPGESPELRREVKDKYGNREGIQSKKKMEKGRLSWWEVWET